MNVYSFKSNKILSNTSDRVVPDNRSDCQSDNTTKTLDINPVITLTFQNNKNIRSSTKKASKITRQSCVRTCIFIGR